MISWLLALAKLTSAWDREPISGFREVAPTASFRFPSQVLDRYISGLTPSWKFMAGPKVQNAEGQRVDLSVYPSKF